MSLRFNEKVTLHPNGKIGVAIFIPCLILHAVLREYKLVDHVLIKLAILLCLLYGLAMATSGYVHYSPKFVCMHLAVLAACVTYHVL